MAIAFSGEFTSQRSPDEVYDFLSDPNKFAPLLPDFESMSVQDATHFTVKVRIGVGNIRGSAEIKMELAESVRPTRAQYKGKGKAVGSQIIIAAGFDLAAVPEGTKITWQGEANIFGKLASMAGGMLEPLGKKNIQKLIDGLQWALTWPPARVVAQQAPGEAAQDGLPEQPPQSRVEGLCEAGSPKPAEPAASPSGEGLHSAASQSEPAAKPATDEIPYSGSRNALAEQAAVAEEPHATSESGPQGETNLAPDVSPGVGAK